jgi:predicted Na+-dependent transporter
MLRSVMRRLLDLLGVYARWALPAGVFAGIVLPDLAALLRPLLTPVVIGTLTTALLRLDWARMSAALRRPGLALLLAGWQLLVSPALVWAGSAVLGLPPDLHLLLVLQAAAPPIGSAPVFALILGLDGALAAIVTVLATLLLPLTLTPLVVLLADTGLHVDLSTFLLRVTLVVIAPFVIAAVLRKGIGRERLRRNDPLVGGLNVLLLVVFAIAVMDGVTARLLAEPAIIGGLLLASCVAALLLHAAGYAAFRWTGARTAFNVAVLSGNRNMGLMLAITAGTAGEAFSLYAGIAQIPMYFAPLLLLPFVRRAAETPAAR